MAQLSNKHFLSTGADGIDVVTVVNLNEAPQYVRSRSTAPAGMQREGWA